MILLNTDVPHFWSPSPICAPIDMGGGGGLYAACDRLDRFGPGGLRGVGFDFNADLSDCLGIYGIHVQHGLYIRGHLRQVG